MGNGKFNLIDFGPGYSIDRYSIKTPYLLNYTLGIGGVILGAEQQVRLMKIDVNTDGNTVEWTYTFNLNDRDSYAKRMVTVDPGYQFITRISGGGLAFQNLRLSILFINGSRRLVGSVAVNMVWGSES